MVRPDQRMRVVGSQIDGRSFWRMRAWGIWAMTMLKDIGELQSRK
jgi:hypothetical protein